VFVASNCTVMVDDRKQSRSVSENCCNICLEGPRNPRKNLRHDSLCPDRDSSPGLPEYEVGVDMLTSRSRLTLRYAGIECKYMEHGDNMALDILVGRVLITEFHFRKRSFVV
jgi:hypothetical protein